MKKKEIIIINKAVLSPVKRIIDIENRNKNNFIKKEKKFLFKFKVFKNNIIIKKPI
jgi:hypothetical protein